MRCLAGVGRIALLVVLATVLAGCAVELLDLGGGRPAPADAPPPAECRAETYDFAGEGTFSELGLVGQSRAELPEPNRPATIWVTHDLLPFDPGESGGPVEMTRMLCFEFADGSGGTDWPVDAGWRPPGALDTPTTQGISTTTFVLLALAGALLIAGSFLAFRRR